MIQQDTPRRSRAVNVLGAITIGILVLSSVCALITIFFLSRQSELGTFARIVETVPLIGLPIGIVLIAVLTTVIIRQRRREQS
ncbi:MULTISPECIES: hypothetical protein [unclassified Pseudoclavibacter]|uniref:hypothetical protein n=1 Tax=unclassified Pseudoclavibacter TaxID=2615177 RepID=UPI00130161F7|nr:MULTISPECIES: hypothetical protein [unclassified Pseudoclavibacter]KAB1647285.1 hypothetical protein F8O06_01560 [Pseudoclavibacter sp. CFCC 14310]KAB1657621.1 hypothetical protein F8O09_08325 [Pseudoclavibacter sp. CFCC 11306]KAB1660503.1 hypothetical protein F8O07_00455 [Pseudoclavibacter sp. CFCC 13796]KAB1662722.1 hypothetical protein F8O08_09110 [Pseudoclavibacter sp. CFCC 13611]